jgi:hypothetical protein
MVRVSPKPVAEDVTRPHWLNETISVQQTQDSNVCAMLVKSCCILKLRWDKYQTIIPLHIFILMQIAVH